MGLDQAEKAEQPVLRAGLASYYLCAVSHDNSFLDFGFLIFL